jgi:uncharacterized SAM-binding protein YcdF (DUF218 family)
MLTFLYNLKDQATVLNGLFVLLILAYIFNRYQKRKLATLFLGTSILLFLLCSTSYFPEYITNKLERKYSSFNLSATSIDTGKIVIHVLGSGYTLDKKLPANAQLGLVGLGRLAEGIRIHRLIKNSIIICSGYSSLGLETQAQVTKRAAIVLGVDADKLETLNTPRTTKEEAEELGKRYSKMSQLIIVTDAIHMPRAIKLFKAEGFNPTAAPTNYKVSEGLKQNKMKWWPSIEDIGLMNYVIHEYLGNLKASIFK